MIALLDTHVVLWWFEQPKRLSAAQRRMLAKASDTRALAVSDASRIIVATARVLGIPLVTSDTRIIDSKLVPTIR
ncbi:MAG: hypothetical protein M3Y87_12910 [Myxococcota bacterium]|nr:hypothetical protein [Myxococcota bacterium]